MLHQHINSRAINHTQLFKEAASADRQVAFIRDDRLALRRADDVALRDVTPSRPVPSCPVNSHTVNANCLPRNKLPNKARILIQAITTAASSMRRDKRRFSMIMHFAEHMTPNGSIIKPSVRPSVGSSVVTFAKLVFNTQQIVRQLNDWKQLTCVSEDKRHLICGIIFTVTLYLRYYQSTASTNHEITSRARSNLRESIAFGNCPVDIIFHYQILMDTSHFNCNHFTKPNKNLKSNRNIINNCK